MCLVHEKKMKCPQYGQECCFPANLDLANILGDMDFDFENCMFWIYFLGFPDFQVSGFPDSQISRLSARDSQSILCDSSAVAPRRSRTIKLVRSKELAQYRENPLSASPVWGKNSGILSPHSGVILCTALTHFL